MMDCAPSNMSAPHHGHIFETERRTRHRILTSTQRCNGAFPVVL